MALAVTGGLLRRATEINRSNNRASLGINHGCVWLAVTENINAFRHRFKHDAIRTALHLNGLDRFQALAVPHHYRTAAAEAVVRLGVNRRASRPSVGNCAGRFERVEVKD